MRSDNGGFYNYIGPAVLVFLGAVASSIAGGYFLGSLVFGLGFAASLGLGFAAPVVLAITGLLIFGLVQGICEWLKKPAQTVITTQNDPILESQTTPKMLKGLEINSTANKNETAGTNTPQTSSAVDSNTISSDEMTMGDQASLLEESEKEEDRNWLYA